MYLKLNKTTEEGSSKYLQNMVVMKGALRLDFQVLCMIEGSLRSYDGDTEENVD